VEVAAGQRDLSDQGVEISRLRSEIATLHMNASLSVASETEDRAAQAESSELKREVTEHTARIEGKI
jgi:hypothetical protein